MSRTSPIPPDRDLGAAKAKADRDRALAALAAGERIAAAGQGADLSELKADASVIPTPAQDREAKRQPPGWNATVRRMEAAGGNIYTAADTLGIFPRAGEVLQDRVISTLVAGLERRLSEALGPIGRLVVGKRRRRAFVNAAAGFAYGNGLTLLIVGVEAERERKSRGKAGAR